MDVRKCYFTIVHQILANGQHEQIAEFASRWNDKRKPDKDLFSVLQDALVQEEEGVILTGVLQDLGMLLYYGE